jgi:hypothetical protein
MRSMKQDWPQFQVDRTALSVTALDDDANDLDYWLSKTPDQRMEALELLRQVIYGYDPADARLQRILEVVDLKDLR